MTRILTPVNAYRNLTSILLSVAALNFGGCARLTHGAHPSFQLKSIGYDSYYNSKYRGWDHVVNKLKADGIEEPILAAVYADERMPLFEEVPFKLNPQEPANIYSQFFATEPIASARQFLKDNKETLAQAEKKHGVSRYVIAGILLVETRYGRNTGNFLVVDRLSRLAGIAEPRNLHFNFNEISKTESGVTFESVKTRAAYLEETFYPQLLSLFRIYQAQNWNLFELKGSRSGAFGIPQFLPGSFENYAVDGNEDAQISLFDMRDAIHSVGNYLKSKGWNNNASHKDKQKVIWTYNHSQAYIDTVLKLASILAKNPTASKQPVQI